MNRRIWVLAPVLLALVLLLAFTRGSGTNPSASAPPSTGARVAAENASRTTAPREADGETGDLPRHPEIGFRDRARLNEHFRKHGREFHAKKASDYLRLAQMLRDRPRGPDVLQFVRNDAVTCRFDRSSGAFIAYNSDGTIRTFFRPNDGEAYFERQKSRAHDSR